MTECKYSTSSRHRLVQLAFANKQHIVPPDTFNYHIIQLKIHTTWLV